MSSIPTPPALGPDFGPRLREWRGKAKLSQEALATALGASRRQIIRWERGEQQPAGTAAQAYQALCGGTLAALVVQRMGELSAQLRAAEELQKKISAAVQISLDV